jgi:hypothetical protein
LITEKICSNIGQNLILDRNHIRDWNECKNKGTVFYHPPSVENSEAIEKLLRHVEGPFASAIGFLGLELKKRHITV